MAKQNNPKFFVLQWSRNYQKKYGVFYKINWAYDTLLMRRLISKVPKSDLVKVIDFAFTNHPATQFLRVNNHQLRIFSRSISDLLVAMKFKGNYIPDDELRLDIPFWQDERVSRLWQLIVRSDLESIKSEVRSNAVWDLLFAKIQRQDGFIPAQVEWFYDLWKADETLERKAIKYERRKRRNKLPQKKKVGL